VGDPDVIEQEIVVLYREHAPGLMRYGSDLAGDHGLSEDAVQEAFFRYFTARGDGRPIPNPRAWLYRVTRNYLLDLLRSAETKEEVGIEDLPDEPDRRPDPETVLHQMEAVRGLWQSLTPRERECLRLRVEGLRYDEICRVLDIKTGTVAALLARAHQKLRRGLEPQRAGRPHLALPEETSYVP
jgi:RNA polymerase sigma-70 factor (ECF subfamily)